MLLHRLLPDERPASTWAQHQAIGLAMVYGLIAAIMSMYAVVPPVSGTPKSLDSALVFVLVALAGLSIVLIPRLRAWALDPLLVAAWISVGLITLTRPTPTGQASWGALLLVTALYAAYFTTGLRFALHLAGMTVMYLGVRIVVHDGSGSYFFMGMTVAIALSVALVIHHLKGVDRRYQLVVDNASDVIMVSRSGLTDWVSPSVQRVLGWSAPELVGRPSTFIWHPDDVTRAEDLRQQAYGGQRTTGTFRLRHKDGHYVWIEYNARPMLIRGAMGAVAALRDVTARVTAEEEARQWERRQREQALRQAEAAEAKARLFQNISHELRTPLAIVGGPLHDLRQHADLTPTERAGLDAAVRANARMERLVDGLMDIARGQSEQLALVAEPVDLTSLTRGAIEMFADLAAGYGLTLQTHIDDVPPRVLVDPEAWLTILVNLLSNAVKYTSDGGIRVHLDHVTGEAHLTVSDTGVGIAQAELPHVFERYSRTPSRPVHGESGSGIGLALVNQILQSAHGRSHVSSVENAGTTVQVWMPAPTCPADSPSDSAHHLDVAARRNAWALQSANPVAAQEPVADGRGRILVVEDNADLRAHLDGLLHRNGWETTSVATAEEALPLVGTHDLVLSDVMLPGANGIELVRQVRESADGPRWVPIILLTARADSDAVVQGLTSGADDYVTKPFSPAELLARVRTHVELSFLRQVVLDQAVGRAENLERALDSNRMIGTALGIIMATEKVSADEAFDRLRLASQHANRKLRDVADDVIYTGALP